MSRFSRRRSETTSATTLACAGEAAARGLRRVIVWQTGRTSLKLAFAGSMAVLAGSMIELGVAPAMGLVACVAALLLAAACGMFAERSQVSAEAEVTEVIRARLRQKLQDMEARDVQALPAGALIAGLQRHPDAVASLVVGHRAAAAMLGIGPLLAVAAMLAVSWQAAAGLILASPVMIVFFIVVGGTIHARAEAQERAFGQLAAQFEDRIRTLPTILSGHGLEREEEKLATRMAAYARSTMGVLKVAFLNAGIIDFFASLSIAMLAVLLGLGHLRLIEVPGFAELQLWQSLFILMLAPEFFAPFRRYAEQYHAKAEGNAAAAALDAFLDAPHPPAEASRLPILDRFAPQAGFHLPPRGLVAIVGPSGSGKSTLLRRFAGLDLRDGASAPATQRDGADWISTDIPVMAGTLSDVLSWNRGPVCRTRLLLAASRVGLLDDGALPGGLEAGVKAGGENLSGGQRLRIGAARALLSNRTIFADEPTAKLDPLNAGRVRLALFDCARERLVVVATHDRDLARAADILLDLGGQGADARAELVE